MDWVHCNTCGIQPSANVADIFRLTSCGHIFCQYCEKEGVIEECKVCRNKDATTIKLSSEMKPEIQVYFQDTEVLASQLFKVIEFQKGHRMRFIQFLQKKIQKYNLAKMHISKLEERMKKENEIKMKLVEQNKSLMRELESYRNRGQMDNPPSPISNLNRPIFPTNSRASQLIKTSAEKAAQNQNRQKVINSPFSICSTPSGNYQNYRNPKNLSTPTTPLSLISNSPCTPFSNISHTKSVRSDISGSMPRHAPQQYRQSFSMAGRTPPNINVLKIANVPPRSPNDEKYYKTLEISID